jgi:DNA-binding MarR family transcriptional regulator
LWSEFTAIFSNLAANLVSVKTISMEYTDVLINIRKIVRSLNLESKRIQKEFGVSIPQLLCLDYLSTCEQYQSTITRIATYLNLNLSTVTGIVNRLEKKGLLARLPKKGDKRVSNITLTTHGLKLLEHSPELMHQQLSAKLMDMPTQKLVELNNSLQFLVDIFHLDFAASPLLAPDDLTADTDL